MTEQGGIGTGNGYLFFGLVVSGRFGFRLGIGVQDSTQVPKNRNFGIGPGQLTITRHDISGATRGYFVVPIALQASLIAFFRRLVPPI